MPESREQMADRLEELAGELPHDMDHEEAAMDAALLAGAAALRLPPAQAARIAELEGERDGALNTVRHVMAKIEYERKPEIAELDALRAEIDRLKLELAAAEERAEKSEGERSKLQQENEGLWKALRSIE